MEYSVRKETGGSLCKLRSWNIRLEQDTSAFVFISEAGSRWCRLAECYLCLCSAASQRGHYSLGHGQNILNYQWAICYCQPLLWPPNKFSAGMEPLFLPSTVISQCQNLALKFLEGFCLWETVNSISFGIKALISPLKYHINAELPWVDEFTVLVILFCWKSQIWFRNNSVHCDRNKNSSLIKSINKRAFYP